jgi:hypothetical protein
MIRRIVTGFAVKVTHSSTVACGQAHAKKHFAGIMPAFPEPFLCIFGAM